MKNSLSLTLLILFLAVPDLDAGRSSEESGQRQQAV